MNEPALRIERSKARDRTLLRLSGVLSEDADLTVMEALEGDVTIDLQGLKRINSFGVRLWVHAVEDLSSRCHVELQECPPAFVDLANMLSPFLAQAHVRSFRVPYLCEPCDVESSVTVFTSECMAAGSKLPAGEPCPSCNEVMELNVVESLYLRFLRN